MTDDPNRPWNEAREKLRAEALLRDADEVPHAHTAFAAQRFARDCDGFVTAREQLRAVRLHGEPAYDAADLADAEAMVAMQRHGLRDRAVELLALVVAGEKSGSFDLADRLNDTLDNWITEGEATP